MVFICFAVYVLANNTRVVPYFKSCMVAWRYTASKFGILDDFCVIKKIICLANNLCIYGIKLLYISKIVEQIGPICGAFRSAIPDMSNTVGQNTW